MLQAQSQPCMHSVSIHKFPFRLHCWYTMCDSLISIVFLKNMYHMHVRPTLPLWQPEAKKSLLTARLFPVSHPDVLVGPTEVLWLAGILIDPSGATLQRYGITSLHQLWLAVIWSSYQSSHIFLTISLFLVPRLSPSLFPLSSLLSLSLSPFSLHPSFDSLDSPPLLSLWVPRHQVAQFMATVTQWNPALCGLWGRAAAN